MHSIQHSFNHYAPSSAAILDINSIARNILVAINGASKFITGSLIFAGIGGMLTGAQMVTRADRSYAHAEEIHDDEGRRRARINAAKGYCIGYLGLGQLSTASFSSVPYPPQLLESTKQILSNLASEALKYCQIGLSVGVLIYSVGLAISTALDWPKTSALRAQLQGVLKNDPSSHDKVLAGLEFVKEQVSLTPAEQASIPEGEDRENAVRAKVEAKISAFTEQVGERLIAELGSDRLEQIIDDLQNHREGALSKAQNLLRSVDKELVKTRIYQITCLAVSVLMIVGTIVGLLGAGPAAVPIIFAVTSGFWLSIDAERLRDKIGDGIYYLSGRG